MLLLGCTQTFLGFFNPTVSGIIQHSGSNSKKGQDSTKEPSAVGQNHSSQNIGNESNQTSARGTSANGMGNELPRNENEKNENNTPNDYNLNQPVTKISSIPIVIIQILLIRPNKENTLIELVVDTFRTKLNAIIKSSFSAIDVKSPKWEIIRNRSSTLSTSSILSINKKENFTNFRKRPRNSQKLSSFSL